MTGFRLAPFQYSAVDAYARPSIASSFAVFFKIFFNVFSQFVRSAIRQISTQINFLRVSESFSLHTSIFSLPLCYC